MQVDMPKLIVYHALYFRTMSQLQLRRILPAAHRYVKIKSRRSIVKALLQRVTEASVSVDGDIVGRIKCGLVALVGVGRGDTKADARQLADKTSQLRIFADDDGKFNLSAIDVKGEVLVVSQFTLMACTAKGRRPSFTDAAPPPEAEKLIDLYISYLKETGLMVKTGVFQAYMQVQIHNDGPVTIMLNSKDTRRK